jgi:uncharacterized membrane protein
MSAEEKGPDVNASVLNKLEELVRNALDESSATFTREEAEALKRVAARERAWMAVGHLAGFMKGVMTYIGFFLAAWIAIKAEILQWIARELGR